MGKEESIVSREQLLGVKARRFVAITVPGLPGKVRLRSLTEREKTDYELAFLDKKGNTDKKRLDESRRALICLVVVDANGNPILSDEDVKALQDVDAMTTTTIYGAAMKFCGFNIEEPEELRKN